MTGVTMTLAEFLLARIAEDEAAATYLRDQYPHETGPAHLSGNMDDVRVTTGFARVLAECEAKRRIVEEVYPELAMEFGWNDVGPQATLLRLLALPNADHPDYDESWRP